MGDIHTAVALMHPALRERRDMLCLVVHVVPFPGSGPPLLHGLGIFTGSIYHHGPILVRFASYRPIVISLMVLYFVYTVFCISRGILSYCFVFL